VTFAAYLKRLREEAGLNQREVADRAKTTVGMISFFEIGRELPSEKLEPRLIESLKLKGTPLVRFTRELSRARADRRNRPKRLEAPRFSEVLRRLVKTEERESLGTQLNLKKSTAGHFYHGTN
jgi:transcriptional regulator with XRE-family HTH domain